MRGTAMPDYHLAFWNLENLFQVNFLLKPGDERLVIIGSHWPARVSG